MELSDQVVEKWVLTPVLLMTCFVESKGRIKYLFLQALILNGKYLTFFCYVQRITDEKHYVRAG